MASEHIYIAQELRLHGSQQFKVGNSTQISRREGSLRGQADTDYRYISVFPTDDCVLAEGIAHQTMDELGLRKIAGSRREIFVGDYDLIQSICEASASRASRIARARRPPFAERRAEPRKGAMAHPERSLSIALETPVTWEGASMPIGELMYLALNDAAAARRLEQRHGVRCLAKREKRSDFEINWGKAATMLKWMTQRGCAMPIESRTRSSFSSLA